MVMGIWPCCILGLGGIGLLLQHSNWSEKLSQHFPCEYFQKCFVFHISDYSTSNDNHLWNYRSLELVLSFQLIDQTALQNSHQFRSLSHRISWSLFLVSKPESIAIACQKTQRTNSARWNGHSHISTIKTKDTFWDVTEKIQLLLCHVKKWLFTPKVFLCLPTVDGCLFLFHYLILSILISIVIYKGAYKWIKMEMCFLDDIIKFKFPLTYLLTHCGLENVQQDIDAMACAGGCGEE